MATKPLTVPAVILNRVKYPHNLAAAIRACSCFGVDSLVWTGSRFSFADGERLPREERMKGYAHVNFFEHERPFDLLPDGVTPVCVELVPHAEPLTHFEHPERAAYVFGPEDGSVSQAFRGLCHRFVYIPSQHCLNLSAAMNVVLADRAMKRQRADMEAIISPGEYEGRGFGELSVVGWDGK